MLWKKHKYYFIFTAFQKNLKLRGGQEYTLKIIDTAGQVGYIY